jgi:hypothetical protein
VLKKVDEGARPQEISAFCKLPLLACGTTEAAEVEIEVELHSSVLLLNGYLLRSNPEECNYHLLHDRSLKSHKDHCNFLIFKRMERIKYEHIKEIMGVKEDGKLGGGEEEEICKREE